MIFDGVHGLRSGPGRYYPAPMGRFDGRSVLVTGGSDCHGLSKGKPLIG